MSNLTTEEIEDRIKTLNKEIGFLEGVSAMRDALLEVETDSMKRMQIINLSRMTRPTEKFQVTTHEVVEA